MNDMFDDIAKMAKTEEGRAELIALAEHIKGEFKPMFELAIELFGEDLDNAVDGYLGWMASKTMVMYDAYINEGFTRNEAIALTIGAKATLGEALSNLR